MTENMNRIADTVRSIFLRQETLPTIDEIIENADKIRNALSALYPLTDEEYAKVKSELLNDIVHTINGDAITLRGRDSSHKSWYYNNENDHFYWNRYKTYLRSVKHWSVDVVNKIDQTTNGVMDDLGNPKGNNPFQRRGLLLGDVQSGKTATYTAICNKASDAGYRVIIILAGMMENLRVQTQSRLDTEFVGIESKHTLDKKADNEIRNQPVGVGKIPPLKQEKRIACFTSVATDFNKNTLRALGLSLRTLNGTALFVVKKNKSVLNNLFNWLRNNNANHETGLIDLPLLLIDDEADNASVNTNSEEKDPTAINRAIRNILNCFKQASYLGITATPFANIFIDPDVEHDEAAKDLFPKDFLTVLPTPEKYIGATKIFGYGDADNWDDDRNDLRVEGEYGSAVIPIENEEQEDFYVFKHKKELANDLVDIPPSMKEAIRYFILATAVSDTRLDENEHRSMLVNVSRFTMVQNITADLIDAYVTGLKSDLENYSKLSIDKAMQISGIRSLYHTWEKYHLSDITKQDWNTLLHDHLNKAARRISVRAVNQKHGAASLNYNEEEGLRVIAVGGNSLSRGLTLEGLVVSYFYRNTMMYDTLLQMGRWFGYRFGYEDLFKLWIAEDAIDWYGYISDAVCELKEELNDMKRQHLTPKDFGLKVRRAPGALLVTARNKMRTATSVNRPITVSGRMLETPRLKSDNQALEDNKTLCLAFFKTLSADSSIKYSYDPFTSAHIWQDVPKSRIAELVRNFNSHPWNLNFQPFALADYIDSDNSTLDYWDVAIPQPKRSNNRPVSIQLIDSEISVIPEVRNIKKETEVKNMIKISDRHVRVGAGGCSKIGLTESEILEIRERCKHDNKRVNDKEYLDTKQYLGKQRKPIALIHIVEKRADNNDDSIPQYVYALGLGFPEDGNNRTANYMVNINELKNWVDIVDEDDDDDDSE